MQVIGQAVLDLNESDWGSGSGWKVIWQAVMKESDWASGSRYK